MAVKDSYDVAVIGAGPGGYAAAFLCADLGLSTILIDNDSRLGGTCLLRGCIPSKALLHAAHVVTAARELATWGIEFGPPSIEVAKLRNRKEQIIAKLSQGIMTLAATRHIEVVRARAALDTPTRLRLNSGDEIRFVSFQHCILATGSRPAVPPALRLDDPRWMDSTEALEIPEIPSRLLVVGGGYIGMEMATVYASLGSQVTVVEGTDRLIAGADPDLIRPLEHWAAEHLAAIRLHTQVQSLQAQPQGIRARLVHANQSEELVFDRVLVAVGRRPNSENLGLENTRVQVDSRGFVRVDAQRRTAEPSIFAIGDVAGEPMLAHKASHEGRVAAEVIAGKNAVFEPRAIPAVVFTNPEIAWCGLTEEEAKAKNIPHKVAKFSWAASGRATTIGRNDGLTKLVLEPESGRVLGVGIVGDGAGELISEGVLAVEMGAVAEDVARSIHPHPTLSETLMESAESFYGFATHIYTRRK